ncbi:ABC transporter permease [Natronincola ferrireducens]|uniref:Nucleoside ABC transporter membrane protein n=1 Tax=Natronincola ferrireducens TaxID=393762 RepID=A0A1G9A9K0_9FIRM|nr:ABC transporter permease [Natronincola ferrireducens]SDK23130.1 nucleoside ABC transporter membrane protein [Natronincola ferrireducens]
MNIDNTISVIIASTIRMSIPLILAAVGGSFSARSGVMALGLEGMLLSGAFFATIGSYYTGNPWIGLLCGMIGGGVIAFFHGVLTTRYRVNHVISGIGLNLLVIASTTLFLQLVWDSRGNSPSTPRLPRITIPGLSDLPLIGGIFINQSILFFFTIAVVIISWIVMFKTTFGLRLRMVGENPQAASTVGINVKKVRYIAVIVCGLLAGAGGAYLSIDHLSLFVREMTAGRGYIAVVINILGRFNPLGIVGSGIIFGFADALQMTLQGGHIPNQIIQMIPYVVTLLVLTFGVQHIKGPAGMGKNID